MKGSRKTGQKLADESNVLIALGLVIVVIALAVGFIGIGGAFSDGPTQGRAAMLIAAAFGFATLAAGVNARKSARLAGWKPNWEQGSPQSDDAPEEAGERKPAPSPTESVTADKATESPAVEENVAAPSTMEEPPIEAPVEDEPPTEQPPITTVPEILTNPTKRAQRGTLEHQSAAAMMSREYRATLERMVVRTDDIFALAKDLTATGKTVGAFADLSHMIGQSDALKLEEPPRISPIKLTRNGRYWLGSDFGQASNEIYDAVISLEAAFNIAQDAHDALGKTPSQVESMSTRDKALAALRNTGKITPNYSSRTDPFLLAYPRAELAPDHSDWALRMRIANAAENASLPFRIVFDMKVNPTSKLALVLLQIPRPTCFSIVSTDYEEQCHLARDYAFRSALFMARAALCAPDPSDNADLVVVACHERGGSETLLSLEASPHDLEELSIIASQPVPIEEFSHAGIHMSWEHDWLDPVIAHIESDDPLLYPQSYSMHVELSDRACPELLAAATNAQVESDLGYQEGMAMREAWASLASRIAAAPPTTEGAVSAVRALQAATEDPSIDAACSRVMRSLVDGSVEPEQFEHIEAVFMGSSILAQALVIGTAAFGSQDPVEMERAVSQLESALSPGMQIEFMDDTETVFRYFRTTAERIIYNLHQADGRRVCLVPHSYYAANEMLAHLLCLLKRPEEALPFVDEIMRLAPISAGAAVSKARVLEDLSRIFEASDLVNEAITRAATVHDAALAYYRMAYLQWRAGNHSAAAACYREALSMHTRISQQAQTELDELLESDIEQKDYTPDEARNVLRESGVNIWPRNQRYDEIARAAVLCSDARLFPSALQLTIALLEFRHDDAIIDVCRSYSQ